MRSAPWTARFPFAALRPGRVAASALGITIATGACAGGGNDVTGATAGGVVTSTYVGTFVSQNESGTVTLTTARAGASDALRRTGISLSELSAATLQAGGAAATLVTVGGVAATLSGTFNATTGLFSVSGNDYTFNGTASTGVVAGSYSGPEGNGQYATVQQATTGAAPRTYCGNWQRGTDFGWFNIVVAGSVVTGAASGPHDSPVVLTGSASGTAFSGTTSDGAQPFQGALSTDLSSISGSFGTSGSPGTFSGADGACNSSGGGTSSAPTILNPSGFWQSAIGIAAGMQITILVSGSAVTGTGVITTQPIAPSSGPASPAWTGDGFTITSGSYSNGSITFASTLVGANGGANGTVLHGTLSFTGTLTNATTMTGTLTFTPTATLTQGFSQQTASVSMTKP